jgi:4-amino-4-deoxy-L-arabinose transferase-like glycosyltransferase
MGSGPSRRFAFGLAAIMAIGLAVRILYTLTVSADLPTVGDAETYHLLANQIADGDGYVRPRVDASVATAEFPPLFPVTVAVVSAIGGDSVEIQKLFTSVVGTLTIALVGLLGRRVAGDATGLVAAALAAIYPMLFQVDGALMAESLYAPLVTGTILATYHAIDRSVPARWALAGALAGLAALTRAEALLLIPLLFVPEAFRHAGTTWPERLRAAGLAVAALVLVISPWLVRNAVVFERFIPISNNSGTLLAGSNCDLSYRGEYRGLWRFECVRAVDIEGLDEPAAFDRLRDTGLDYARAHLDEVPRVALMRLGRTFGVYDPYGQINWETFEGRSRTWQTVGHRVFLVLVPFGAAGAVVLWRRQVPVWPLLAPFALVAITTVVSYGNQRFRIAAEPGLLVLAAVALTAGASRALHYTASGPDGE